MQYEMKFYCGKNTNEAIFLGRYPLLNKYTYNHYLDLLNNNTPFSVWFNHHEGEYIHRNVTVDDTSWWNEGSIDNGDTSVIFIFTMDANKIQLLSDQEFKDQGKINALINQISKEDVGRFFRGRP